MRTRKDYRGEYIITNDYGIEFIASYQYEAKIWVLDSWNMNIEVSTECETLKECKLWVERSFNLPENELPQLWT